MLQLALVGTGHWGPNILRSFENTGRAEVRFICDLDAARLERLAARNPRARTTTRVEDIFRDGEVDAVVISTPVTSHYELSRQVLEAGKHLMVEKPITRTSSQARDLIALAERQGRVLMVGHVFEYNATVQALKGIVDSGQLGQIQYLSFERTNLGPVRTDVNALWDLASHDISIMTYLLGRAPRDVTARGQGYLNEGIEDAAFAVFGFAGGIVAHVNVSWLNPRKVRQITVVGDQKMAVWDDLSLVRPIQIFDRRVERASHHDITDTFFEHKTAVVDGGIYVPSVRLNQPLQAECEHFIDCVEKDLGPHSDGRSGLRVVLALEAASESMRNGSRITAVEPE